MHVSHFIACNMPEYETVHFVGDNYASKQVRVGSSKTWNQSTFSGLLVALFQSLS